MYIMRSKCILLMEGLRMNSLPPGPKSPDPVARMTGGTTLAPPRIGMNE